TPETSSPRLLELVALAEEQPELAALQPYLADPAPAVRREAVAVLTETLPPGTGRALAGALRDGAAEVRAAAAASLRELVETLPPEPALRDGLAAALAEPDPVVRAVALDMLRALSLGDTALYSASLTDSDIAVRIEAVRALVSVDAAAELAGAATTDPSGAVVRRSSREGDGVVGSAVTGAGSSEVRAGPVSTCTAISSCGR
ncbi:HEAT repeat domain-containing protein, partial [Streptomyces scabiei]|uniref:HEAT repeat domain-containing protein n=1 Tax=Streptomyces scabiei TaxID=1930 RepID=UPI0029BDBD96